MPLHALAFLLGSLLFQQQSIIPSTVWLLPPFLLFISSIWLPATRVVAVFLVSFGWAHGYAMLNLPATIPDALLGTDIYIEGQIVDIPRQFERRETFVFDVDLIQYSGKDYTGDWRIYLSWYNNPLSLRAGERWAFKVKLKQVHGFMNPGGFDYEGWRYRQGIRYQGYVRGDAKELLSGYQGLNGLRDWLSDQIFHVKGDKTANAVIQALVIGDKSALDSETRQVFQETGTSHLMAISGLHIGLVAGLLYGLVSSLWRWLPYLCQRVPALIAGAVASILGGLIYAALAGFTMPTQRALIMLVVVMAGMLLRRKSRAANTLSLTLILILMWDPPAVLSAGFWLSFTAVGVILLHNVSVLGRNRDRFGWLRLQVAVTLGLLPVLSYWGIGASIVSPIVNIVAIPLYGLILVPSALFGGLLLGPFPAFAAAWLALVNTGIDWSLQILSWAAGQSPPLWSGANVSIIQVIFAGLGVFLLLAPRGLPLKPLALLLLLPLFFPGSEDPPENGTFQLTLLDVGQGLAVVIRTATHVLVFDTGPQYRSGFDTGSTVVAPFLREYGISSIDRLIVSHGDSDHSGGVSGLLGLISAAEVLAGEPERLDDGEALKCVSGQHWRWDGVDFEIIYPDSTNLLTGNNASCVLRVSNSGGSLLLTGDIEKEAESWLLENVLEQLPNSVVVAPHHGSKTSSTTNFVHASRADYVLFPVGYANRWGFPAETVTQRWVNAGAKPYTTAKSGSIDLLFAREGVTAPVEYRRQAARYWHH